MSGLDEILELVALARQQLRAAEDLVVSRKRLDDAVYAARDTGATWEMIGTALGVSKARAHQKWGPNGSRTRARARKAGGAPTGAPAAC